MSHPLTYRQSGYARSLPWKQITKRDAAVRSVSGPATGVLAGGAR